MLLENTGIDMPVDTGFEEPINTPQPLEPASGGGSGGIMQPPAPQTPAPQPEQDELSGNIQAQRERLLKLLLQPMEIFDPETKAVLSDTKRERFSDPTQPDSGVKRLTDKDLDKYPVFGVDNKQYSDKEDTPSKEVSNNLDKIAVKNLTDSDLERIRQETPKLFKVDKDEQLKSVDAAEKAWFKGIMEAESSGGVNRIHAWAGRSRALGSFGLIPTQSITDVLNKGQNSNFAQEFPKEYKQAQKMLENSDWEGLAKLTLDPKVEMEIAKDYKSILENYIKYDTLPEGLRDDMLALAWNQGAGVARRTYKKGGANAVRNHPYLRKFYQGKNK